VLHNQGYTTIVNLMGQLHEVVQAHRQVASGSGVPAAKGAQQLSGLKEVAKTHIDDLEIAVDVNQHVLQLEITVIV